MGTLFLRDLLWMCLGAFLQAIFVLYNLWGEKGNFYFPGCLNVKVDILKKDVKVNECKKRKKKFALRSFGVTN